MTVVGTVTTVSLELGPVICTVGIVTTPLSSPPAGAGAGALGVSNAAT